VLSPDPSEQDGLVELREQLWEGLLSFSYFFESELGSRLRNSGSPSCRHLL
jgi:hypothetical protein